MTDDDFLAHLVGLSSEKLEIFNSLSEETSHYWSEICDGRFEWQSYREEAIFLRGVRKQDVLEAFDKWLRPGQRRRIACFQVIGNGDGSVAEGRPEVEAHDFDSHMSEKLTSFHKSCKGQVWGRINSKLF